MDVIMIHRRDLDDAIRQAAIMGAELAIRQMPKNRPSQYNIGQAAEELGVHRHTVRKMIDHGSIKLNPCGKISAEELDKAVAASRK